MSLEIIPMVLKKFNVWVDLGLILVAEIVELVA